MTARRMMQIWLCCSANHEGYRVLGQAINRGQNCEFDDMPARLFYGQLRELGDFESAPNASILRRNAGPDDLDPLIEERLANAKH